MWCIDIVLLMVFLITTFYVNVISNMTTKKKTAFYILGGLLFVVFFLSLTVFIGKPNISTSNLQRNRINRYIISDITIEASPNQ